MDTLIVFSTHNGYSCDMNLKHYLDLHKISITKFAEKIGLKSRASLHRYINGSRVPSLKILQKIEQATDGQVTARDFKAADQTPRRQYHSLAISLPADCVFSSQFLPFLGQEEVPWHTGSDPANQNDNYPLRRAAQILKTRLQILPREELLLDQQPVSISQVIKEANRILKEKGQDLIFYPGVNPIPDKTSPAMKCRV